MTASHLSKRLKFLILLLIFSVSLLLRIEYIRNTVVDVPIRADAKQYVTYGYNLARFGVFSKTYPSESPKPDSFRSPGYPLLIAASFFIAGTKNFYLLTLYTQAVLSALIVLLTYFIGRKFLPFNWAIAGAICVALCPHQVSIAGYLLTETLFGFLLHAGILCFLIGVGRRSYPWFFISAVFWSGAYLTNETALFLPFIFGVILLFFMGTSLSKIDKKILLPRLMLFFIVFSLAPAIWTVRNEVNLPPDAPKASERAMSTMSHGAYPGFIYKNPKFKYFPYREDPMQPAFGSSLKKFGEILWRRAKERPWRYFTWYFFEKPYYFWSWNILQGQGDIYIYPVKISFYELSRFANFTRNIMKALHLPAIFLAFASLPLIIIKNTYPGKSLKTGYFLFILTIGIYYTLLYMVFAPWPRYSVPLRPELYLCALWTLHEYWKFMGKYFKNQSN